MPAATAINSGSRRLELEMRRDQETKRFQLLNQRSNDYETSLRIRKYVSALTDKLNEIADEREKAKALEYVQWTNAKADWLDPLVNMKDPLLALGKLASLAIWTMMRTTNDFSDRTQQCKAWPLPPPGGRKWNPARPVDIPWPTLAEETRLNHLTTI